jgi:antitoxin component YwqK of YwqJK toxin-antitoxin module
LQVSLVGQTFEIYKSDTINKTTADNRKVGRWITFYDNMPGQIEKEGFYENNRKTGIWKNYYQNGRMKSEITYVNNMPDGFARLYYESGKVSEQGIWKGTKWVGEYVYYHENGNKAYEWSFNEEGKRTGVQKYYHENGKLRIQGEWIDGKENGKIVEYDSNGNLKSEKVFAAGSIDINSSKFYAHKKVSVDEIPDDTNATVSNTKIENTQNQNAFEAFNGNGTFKLYNALKKVDREGEFQNGKLVNGKKYYYNPDGVLVKTEVYTNGRVTGVIKPTDNKNK